MTEPRFDILGPDDYDRAKTVLNKARHPGFVGRELVYRCATKGVVCVAVVDDVDAGVIMIAAEKVQALSVVVAMQGRGVGQALVNKFRPKWVNAIGERVGFFEKLGYQSVGAPKVGQNGKHSTQLMQRKEDAPALTSEIKAAPPPEAKIELVKRERGEIGRGPVFLALRDVANLPTVTERKAHLLDRLDHIWNQAINRTYINKHGDEVANPDGAIAARVVEVAAELVDINAIETSTGKLAGLAVFTGGRKAG